MQAARCLLKEHGADAVLLSHLPTIRWLTGFTGSRALLLVTKGASRLVTDARYAEHAESEVHEVQVTVGAGPFWDVLRERSLLDGLRRVLFESDHTTVAALEAYQSTAPAAEWVPGTRLLALERACKGERALAAMRKSLRITEEVLLETFEAIVPGMTERQVAARLTFLLLKRGAERMAFDPIVASGPNAALPHARPTDRAIEHGEVILVDVGCIVAGYASDITRVASLGEPSNEVRQVCEIVFRAQAAAMGAACAGMDAKALDSAARAVIAGAGFGNYFVHSLGHGIGMEVHEWPAISQRSEDRLPEHATITLEPGIYLPGSFGIRIEDTVVLGGGGCERLNTLCGELMIL